MQYDKADNRHKILLYALLWVWTAMMVISRCEGANYTDATKIFEDKLGSNSGYKTTVRPLINQSDAMTVDVTFNIVAIVEIDAIAQKFVVNGFLGLSWRDEIVAWNPLDYNNIHYLHPEPKEIWRPRLILTNTIDARDLFKDDYCPIVTSFDGNTTWNPGSLFPVSCKLNLYKFPFDEQNCHIELYSMGWNKYEVEFVTSTGVVGLQFYTKSGEWEMKDTKLTAVSTGELVLSYFKMEFKIQRLPGFFIMNIVIPIVLMSFLNILVFLIPVDSGEKISYGITVLLALTVFMSIVSDQLPRSSDTLPLVTIYLLVLTVISVCTVIMSIIIVYFHHLEEKEVKHQKAVSGFKSLFRKVNTMNQASKNFAQVRVKPATLDRQFSNSSAKAVKNDDSSGTNPIPSKQGTIFNVLTDMRDNLNNPSDQSIGDEGDVGCDSVYVNRWKQFGKHIDCISFIVFTIIWISVTIGFLTAIST